MEEKLYFAPANYGKGAKHAKKSKEKKNHKILKLVSFLLFLAIIAVIIIWLLHGNTTTSGQYPENIRNESLVCESNDITYEKVSRVNSDNKELKISMVFVGSDTLSSGSLKYTLKYSSYGEAHDAEAISHAQFNLGLQRLGYDSSKFNNKFSTIDNELVITLNFSAKSEIDDTTRSYLLLNYDSNDKLPSTLPEYRQNYEQQGFACTSTIDQ